MSYDYEEEPIESPESSDRILTLMPIVLIVLLVCLLLAIAIACDPGSKISDAKEGWEQLKGLTRAGECLVETLEDGQSDACPHN